MVVMTLRGGGGMPGVQVHRTFTRPAVRLACLTWYMYYINQLAPSAPYLVRVDYRVRESTENQETCRLICLEPLANVWCTPSRRS